MKTIVIIVVILTVLVLVGVGIRKRNKLNAPVVPGTPTQVGHKNPNSKKENPAEKLQD